jgi:hypothetical protein
MRLQLKGWVIPTGIGVLSFGVGAGVGYFLAKRKVDEAKIKVEELESEQLQLDFKRVEMDREFNQQIQQSIVVIRELKETTQNFKEAGRLIFLPNFSKREKEDLDKSVDSHPSNETRRITVAPANTKENENIVINVFPDEDDDWDYDEEVKTRSPDHPYIIHRDEYFSNEMDFNQNTLMYYEGDNILCDDKDVPIYNPEKIVGKIIFGHGSRDPSICYVRNEQLMAEYEILIDHGFYTTEVLGTSPDPPVSELKHARPHRVPKFRRDE